MLNHTLASPSVLGVRLDPCASLPTWDILWFWSAEFLYLCKHVFVRVLPPATLNLSSRVLSAWKKKKKPCTFGEGCIASSVLLPANLGDWWQHFPYIVWQRSSAGLLGSVAAEVQMWRPAEMPCLVLVFRAFREEGKPQHHAVGQGKGKWLLVKRFSLRSDCSQTQFLKCT